MIGETQVHISHVREGIDTLQEDIGYSKTHLPAPIKTLTLQREKPEFMLDANRHRGGVETWKSQIKAPDKTTRKHELKVKECSRVGHQPPSPHTT